MTSCIGEPAVDGADGKRKQRIKLSIVEDDDNDRSLILRAVERSPDLEGIGAYRGGVEALNGIPASATEVVLMDVRMPGMQGTDCAQQLRNVRPDLVIVLISGFDQANIAARARDVGADACLAKPFALDQFIEALTICLRRRNARQNGSFPARNPLSAQSAESKETPEPTPPTSLFIDHPAVHETVRRMVSRMEENFHTREDLLQEGLLYLWSREQERPGQTRSWYLQAVRSHLKDFRRSGRSIDSPKRCGTQQSFPENCDEWDHWRDDLEFDEGLFSAVAAREIITLLMDGLNSRDQRILGALAEGYGPCEIAAMLKVSHAFVVQRGRRIAKLAIKLGIKPSPGGSLRRR